MHAAFGGVSRNGAGGQAPFSDRSIP